MEDMPTFRAEVVSIDTVPLTVDHAAKRRHVFGVSHRLKGSTAARHAMAAFTTEDEAILLNPRLMIDGAWRRAYGEPVEDAVRKLADILGYLLRKYGVVTHWLFVESVKSVCQRKMVNICEGRMRHENVDIKKGAAVQLIKEGFRTGIYEIVRPSGAKRDLIYYFTDEQKAKLHRIRREEALAYAISLKQAQDPENPEAGLTDQNRYMYDHIRRLILRRDATWEEHMKKIRKILHVVGLAALLLTGGGIVTTVVLASASVIARADLAGIKTGY